MNFTAIETAKKDATNIWNTRIAMLYVKCQHKLLFQADQTREIISVYN